MGQPAALFDLEPCPSEMLGMSEFILECKPLLHTPKPADDVYLCDMLITADKAGVRHVIEQAQQGRGVWTVIDDGIRLYLASGWHPVNAAGYVITEVMPVINPTQYAQIEE